ncbi:MAG: IS66 family insertion sequence hypothetical protein [Robiginitomaculum sp.]|nr:MAG: IS66 family insertion sequence hypothetical protein [Robiginitomaculum sp.]
MLSLPSECRVWICAGVADMRKGFHSLAALCESRLQQDPYSGHLFVFRGRRGDLLKIVWRDGLSGSAGRACLFTKRLERGRFVWPHAVEGKIHLSSAQTPLAIR